MGYRAQVVTQEREYGSSIFSDHEQFSDYIGKLYELYPDKHVYSNEATDFYEIGKDVAEAEVERLRKLNPTDDFEFQSSWSHTVADTNDDIAISWESALKESPESTDYISLEWY